jgi:hypothetical protein
LSRRCSQRCWPLLARSRRKIVTDGTVGLKVSLSGGEIKIGADLGARRGDNLFHSFEKFGIAIGQTATFTGSGDIKNVISRVTGGEISNIDGRLTSTVRAGCGRRCARSTAISSIRALGWSTMLNVIAPVCGSAPR